MAKGGTTYTTFEAEFARLRQDAIELAETQGIDPYEYIMDGLNNLKGVAETLGPEAVKQYNDEVVRFLGSDNNNGLANVLRDASEAQRKKIIADKQRSDAAAEKEKNKSHGYEGWEETYKQLYGKNINKDSVFLRDKVILPAAAGAANGIANVTNSIAGANAAKHSILGNAMQAMHNTSVFNDLAAQTRAAREANYNTRRAAREQMKAATINGISNAIGSGLNTAAGIANQLAYNESAAVDKAQAATMQKNEQPTGDFYRNEMQMRRYGREDNR